MFSCLFNKITAVASLITLALMPTSSYARDVSIVTTDWAPHYSSKITDGGALTVITKEAFRRVGHNATVSFIPWTRAMKDVVAGNADFVMGAYANEERAKTFILSEAVYDVEVTLVALDTLQITAYDNLQQLKEFTIGVSRGWANTKEFDAADYLTKEVARDPQLNLRKLYRNRIDLTVGARDILNWEARKEKHDVSRLVYLQPPLQTNALHLLGSRATDDGLLFTDDFNRGLAMLKQDGTYAKILRKYLGR
jgi:polar amino acid transport system substrate-binding protein